MSEPQSGRRHGRRARQLSPEEAAALESRTGAELSGEMPVVPGARGAVAPPTADAPLPTLRKFGRRARIIELTDEPIPADAPAEDRLHPASPSVAPTSPRSAGSASSAGSAGSAGSAESAGSAGSAASPGTISPSEITGSLARAEDPDAPSDDATTLVSFRTIGSAASPAESVDDDPAPVASDSSDPSDAAGQASAASTAASAASATGGAPIDRDSDGAELGELAVGDAPAPRPAPRFDGKVLHRPERSGGRPLVWAVWALIALALIVLVALLITGVLGPGSTDALVPGSAHEAITAAASALTPDAHHLLEVVAA